ncbi:MAG TPA: CHAT domain-containing tetratricopeptide repeat protein [Coleofasciculaceae cyanobacterium]
MKDEVSATSTVSTLLQYEHHVLADSMNEERHNLYNQLVDVLLAFDSGGEQSILSRFPNLLDAGLVETMGIRAKLLAQEGDQDKANRLEHLSVQLGTAISNVEANRLLKQGIDQYQTSQFEAALQSWQQALILYHQIENRQGEADCLGNLGAAYESLGQYQLAIDYYQRTLVIAQEMGDHHGEVNSLNNLGNTYHSLGQYQLAIHHYHQALSLAQQIEERRREALILGNLGTAYNCLGQYQKAIEYYQQSLTIQREINDRWGEASSLNNLGIAYQDLGQYEEAIENCQQSLAIQREIGNRYGEAKSLGSLGNAYYSLGQYQRAIDYHQQSLVIKQEIGARPGEAVSLGNLGIAYRSLGEYQRAIDYHQQSLSITREIGDRAGEATSLINIGEAYRCLGQYQLAINYAQQSLTIKREIGDRTGEANSLGSLGNAYNFLAQYQLAINYYQQQLTIAREIGQRQGEANSLGNLGTTYNFLGQYQKAIQYHQQYLVIAREIGDRRGEANSLGNLGNACDSLRQYQLAIDYYQQSLCIKREIGDQHGEATILGNLGNTYNSLGQYPLAIEYHQQSLVIKRKIGDRLGEAQSLDGVGSTYKRLGQYQRAIEYHQQSLAIGRKIGARFEEGVCLNNLGLALLKSGKLAESEQTLLAGIKVWESIRTHLGSNDANKVSIFETQATTYRLLQAVLVAQKKTEDALEIAERGRARAFVELLSERLSANPAEATHELPLPATIEPLTLEQIQQIAQAQNATLVEYSIIYSDNLFIWVIKPTHKIEFCQVDLKPLQQQSTSLSKLVIQAREFLGVEEHTRGGTETINSEIPLPIRHISQPLRQLHQYLIEPISHHLPSDPNTPVIFIPQGTLFLGPFSALQDATGKFLIEQHTILTAPSIQVLELTRKQQQRIETIHELPLSNQNALVVGNPTMPTIPLIDPPQPLNPLPGAEAEANAIASLLNTQAIIGDQATKVDIVQQMPKARLIHLATHGLLDDIKQLGVPGAIALAPSDNDNGFLTAGEILEMKLNAELVVLSACSSGRGKITGDGVIGLSRCLFAAGVPSVIVSLWSVGDKSTQFLMTEFYQNLQHGMNKAQALRQAILTTMNRYKRPKSWAGFTLIGEAE